MCCEVIKMTKSSKKVVSLALAEDCYDQIKELAHDTYRSVPNYIRVIICNYLHRLDRTEPGQEDWWAVK